jgi:integrase/recombinase XerD
VTQVAPTLQAWFTQRLVGQRQASPHTVAAYRDSFRLLFAYMTNTTGKPPAELDFEDLDADAIGEFLAHLEADRVAMAHPGRQDRQPGLHIEALAIPADQGVHRERVPAMRNSA